MTDKLEEIKKGLKDYFEDEEGNESLEYYLDPSYVEWLVEEYEELKFRMEGLEK